MIKIGVFFIAAAGLCAAAAPSVDALGAAIRAQSQWFEPNRGQFPPEALFGGQTRSYGFLLGACGRTTLILPDSSGGQTEIGVRLLASAEKCSAAGMEQQLGRSAYLDRLPQVTGVAHYARVLYSDVYPGIDLVYYFQGNHLEYDFILKPGVEPSRIALAFDGVPEVTTRTGDLVLQTPAGDLIQPAPKVFQIVGGVRRAVAAGYVVQGNVVHLSVGAIDKSLPLTVDPVYVFSSPVGGNFSRINDVAVDKDGYIYVAGRMDMRHYIPPTGGHGKGTGDAAFVARFLPNDGAAPLQMDYFGVMDGNGKDKAALHLGLDDHGFFYVLGRVTGTNPLSFHDPTPCTANSKYWLKKSAVNGGTGDFYWVCPTPDGDGTSVNDMKVGRDGAVYLAGSTHDPALVAKDGLTLPTSGADGFFLKIKPFRYDGASSVIAFDWTTRLGGIGADSVSAIDIGPGADLFITGHTDSTNFPKVYDWAPGSGAGVRGFFTRIRQPRRQVFPMQPMTIVYSTLFGGSHGTWPSSIAADAEGNAHIAGLTKSSDFRTVRPLRSAYNNQTYGDGFLIKFPPRAEGASAIAPAFSTYFGCTTSTSYLYRIATDESGSTYALGHSGSSCLDQVNPINRYALKPQGPFLVKVRQWSPDSEARVELATYLTGAASDHAYSLLWTPSGLLVGGLNDTNPLPLVNALDQPEATSTGMILKLRDRAPFQVTSNRQGTAVGITGFGCGQQNWPTGLTAPAAYVGVIGAECRVSAPFQFWSGTDTLHSFVRWGDGVTAFERWITLRAENPTLHAEYKTQHRLRTQASPAAGGTVSPTGYLLYDAGSTVQLTASANACYRFTGWSPNAPGGTVLMNAPATVTANFAPDSATAVYPQITVGEAVEESSGDWSIAVAVRNTLGKPLANASLVVDGLPPGVSLAGAAGLTACSAPSGSPYVDTGSLAAGATRTVALKLAGSPAQVPAFTIRVLAGGSPR